jgi:proteasome lid subunit RPN8/RPN11
MNAAIASCTITTAVAQTLRALAAASAPHEACGIVLGSAGAIAAAVPAANVAAHPERTFEIDPATLLRVHREARGSGQSVVGWYHSHPNGLAAPSKTDAARATEDGMVWLIVAGGDLSAWTVAAGGDLHGRFARVALVEV